MCEMTGNKLNLTNHFGNIISIFADDIVISFPEYFADAFGCLETLTGIIFNL